MAQKLVVIDFGGYINSYAGYFEKYGWKRLKKYPNLFIYKYFDLADFNNVKSEIDNIFNLCKPRKHFVVEVNNTIGRQMGFNKSKGDWEYLNVVNGKFSDAFYQLY